jgi:hypothetical protein
MPRLVVMTITPLAASVPYSVAAEGPRTISIDWISSGFRSPTRLGVVPPTLTELEPVELSIRTPSMM